MESLSPPNRLPDPPPTITAPHSGNAEARDGSGEDIEEKEEGKMKNEKVTTL
jgi:hypothetical protein